jgi:hypothetical protein
MQHGFLETDFAYPRVVIVKPKMQCTMRVIPNGRDGVGRWAARAKTMTLTFKLTPQLILDAINLIASYGRALRTATPRSTPQNATSAKMSTFGGAGLGQKIQKPNP